MADKESKTLKIQGTPILMYWS